VPASHALDSLVPGALGARCPFGTALGDVVLLTREPPGASPALALPVALALRFPISEAGACVGRSNHMR